VRILATSVFADVKRMIGVRETNALVPRWRADGRTEVRDGVEYLTFPMWQPARGG
jgi:hypothetical protein